MVTHIQQWGNSLAFRIPKKIAESLDLELNTEVEIQERDGTLVLVPVKRNKYSLDELVAQITPENLHGEISTGTPIGNEAW
jgi:antitoxin MazE